MYTLAGASVPGAGSAGFVDGKSEVARFRKPTCVLFDKEESLLVIDSSNHCVRVVSPDWSEVRTLAGGPTAGSTDGPVDKCQLSSPDSGCVLPDGTVLMADRDNNKIRSISPNMESVGTLAGTGEWGAADGFADACMFNKPSGLCCLSSGVVVVADSGNNCIRLLADADTSLNGSVMRSGSPGRNYPAPRDRDGAWPVDKHAAPHHGAVGGATDAGQGDGGTSSALVLSQAWVASEMRHSIDDDDDDEVEDGKEHARAAEHGEIEHKELAYTRAMLDSSDSSNDDEGASPDDAGGVEAQEAKAAWDVSRLIHSTAGRRLPETRPSARTLSPSHQLPWDKPRSTSPDARKAAAATDVGAASKRRRSGASYGGKTRTGPRSGRAASAGSSEGSGDEEEEIVDGDSYASFMPACSDSMKLDHNQDALEQTLEAVAYHLRSKFGTLRQAMSHLSNASNTKVSKEGRWTKQGRLVGVDASLNVGKSDKDAVQLRVVDQAAWCQGLRQVHTLSIDTTEMLDVFGLIDVHGSGSIELRDLEEALRSAARSRVERRSRIAWAAEEAKRAARRSAQEQEAQQLLAGAEAAVAMRDPVLAARRMQLAREKFEEAYRGEEMLLDVERELDALQKRIDKLQPDRYGNSVPTPPRVGDKAREQIARASALNATGNSSIAHTQIGGYLSESLLNDTSSFAGGAEGKGTRDGNTTLNSSRAPSVAAAAGDKRKPQVVYEAKAQLFRPSGADASSQECSYVSAVSVQVKAMPGRSYAKDSPPYTLSILRMGGATGPTTDGVSVLDSHVLDGHVKAEVKGSPFWVWLSWPVRADSVEQRRYGLRFASARQATQVESVCRHAAMPEWQRPADSILKIAAASAADLQSTEASVSLPADEKTLLLPAAPDLSHVSPPEAKKSAAFAVSRALGSKAGAAGRARPGTGANKIDRQMRAKQDLSQAGAGATKRSVQQLEDILRSQVDNLEAALHAVDTQGLGYLSRAEVSEALLVLSDMEGLELSHDDVQGLVQLAAHTQPSAAHANGGRSAGEVHVQTFVAHFRPASKVAVREWAGGAAPTAHELGLDLGGTVGTGQGQGAGETSLALSVQTSVTMSQALHTSEVALAASVMKSASHSTAAVGKGRKARLAHTQEQPHFDVLKIATKSNPNGDLLSSMAMSHKARKSPPGAQGNGEQKQPSHGLSDAAPSTSASLSADALALHAQAQNQTSAGATPVHRALPNGPGLTEVSGRRDLVEELEHVLRSGRGSQTDEQLGPNAANARRSKGVRKTLGGSPGADGKVSIDANLLTRCIEALRLAGQLEQRTSYVEQVLCKYQDAVVSTVSQCAERWDYTNEAWEAPGEEASHRPIPPPGGKAQGSEAVPGGRGKVLVIGGVRYVTVPGMDALRTLHKPHDLLHDSRLSGASQVHPGQHCPCPREARAVSLALPLTLACEHACARCARGFCAVLSEPFFSRGHRGRFGFKADVADRVARVSDSLTAALKITNFPPSASPPPYTFGTSVSSPDAGGGGGSHGQLPLKGILARSLEPAGGTATPPHAHSPPNLAHQSSGRPTTRGNVHNEEAPVPGGLAAARPGIGDVNEQRWRAIEALMRMEFDAHDAAALATGRALYKHLTSLLAPEALLCEWQIADALGVAAFRDQDAFFYLVDNSRSAAI